MPRCTAARTSTTPCCRELIRKIDELMQEFVFEGELYTIPEYDLKLAEEYFEVYTFAMNLFV